MTSTVAHRVRITASGERRCMADTRNTPDTPAALSTVPISTTSIPPTKHNTRKPAGTGTNRTHI
ncbi:MAG TPA: hypothetical protein VGW38_08590 [Chloroflexota bacterium]|nr:hypothetical protein [Chloroflexota bacterium]